MTITGAAGQIAYALLFRIASGQLLGPDTPVRLQLLEIPQAVAGRRRHRHGARRLRLPPAPSVEITDNADGGHSTAPTSRSWSAPACAARAWNAPTSSKPTAASSARKAPPSTPTPPTTSESSSSATPAKTNALITRAHAPDIPADRFTAMMRLDHNRAVSQIARQLAVPVDAVREVTIWGNHSSTQYPDLSHAEVNGSKVSALVDESWTREVFIPTVPGRGAAILDARGASSAASAANAAIGHVQNWIHGTPADTWTSAAVVSDGSYGVPEGLVSGFPVVSRNGRYQIAQGLRIDQRSRDGIDHSVTELLKERDLVVKHGPVSTAI